MTSLAQLECPSCSNVETFFRDDDGHETCAVCGEVVPVDVSALADRLASSASIVDPRDATIAELTAKNARLSGDFRQMETMLDELMKEYDLVASSLKQAKSEHCAKDELREAEIARMRASAKEAEAKAAQAQAMLDAAQNEVDAMKTARDAAAAERDAVRADAALWQERYQSLKAQAQSKLERAQAKCHSQQITIDERTSERDHLQAELDAARARADAAQVRAALCPSERVGPGS